MQIANQITNPIRILRPPTITDNPELQRVANVLHYMYLLFLFLLGITAFLFMRYETALPQPVLINFLLFTIMMGVAFVLVHIKKVDFAMKYLIVAVLIGLTYVGTVSGGIQGFTNVAFLSAITLTYGIIGMRWGIGASIVAVVVLTFLFIADQRDWITPVTTAGQPFSNSLAYFNYFLNTVAIAVFMFLNIRRINDTTQQLKESEARLKETASWLEQITDNIPARISYIDRNERIQFANKQMFKAFDPNAERRIGQRVVDSAPPNIYDIAKPHFAQVLAGHDVRYEYTTDAGRLIEVIYVPHRVGPDQIEGFFSMARDITDQRSAERALQQSQRLESLGLLAGGIAHDFNNLLMVMLAQNSLAERKLADDHKAIRHVRRAVTATRKAANLTQQMLAYSGRGQFNVKHVDLSATLKENVRLIKSGVSKNIAIHTQYADDLPLVEADTTQIQQVVMNLIFNAAQAIGTTDTGAISLKTYAEEVDSAEAEANQLTGRAMRPGRHVVIEVEDTGCGMTQTQLSKIFDPFYSTKKDGTGLGLAAVLGILRGHNGGIRVISAPDKGTTFQLLFPVDNVKAPPTLDLPVATSMLYTK